MSDGMYPAGVTDNDPHFRIDGSSRPETETEYWRRKARERQTEPDHDPDCKCNECECPY